MPFVVEDGTGVGEADSFASVAQARQYAAARGKEFPDNDVEVEQLLTLAIDYLKTIKFSGEPLNSTQSLPFPRVGFGLPSAIVSSQIILALEARNADLQPNPTAEVQREKVDVLEVQYFPSSSRPGERQIFSKVEALLEPYLAGAEQSSGSLCLKSQRI